MNVIQAIQKRRSIRKYTNKPLDYESLIMIMEAGFRAPSTGDVKDYRFILITNPDRIKEIGNHCQEQYWIQQAPAIIAICSDLKNTKEYYPKKAKEFAKSNAHAATQNILLAATEMKLGSCWVAYYDEKKIKEILKIGDNELQAIVTLGHSDEIPKKNPEPNLAQYIFFEDYGNQIRDVDAEMKYYSQKIEKLNQATGTAFERTIKKIKQYFEK